MAEDNAVNQKVARAIIEQLGFDVDIAANGSEAVQLVAANAYSVVFMDLQMPVMDGYAAATAIRDELHSTVPIVALSASVLPGDVERCEGAGMNGRLAKPIDRSAMRDTLDRVAALLA